jgi:hypothetical protein
MINGSVLQGSMTVALSESSGSSLTGTWASTSIGSGTLTGTVNGSSISMTFTPSVPTSCSFSVTATVNGNQVSGTDTSPNCSLTGSVSLTKQ